MSSRHESEAAALARRLRASNAAGGKSASRKLTAALRRSGSRTTRNQGSWRNAQRTAQTILKCHRGGKAGDAYSEKEGRLLYTSMLGLTAKKRELEWALDQARHPKVQHLFSHISISRPVGGEMSDEKWRDLVKVTLREIGAEGVNYVVTHHNNTDHPHCHIVFSLALPSGKLLSTSNNFYRWRVALRVAEQEVGLVQMPFQHQTESAQSDAMVNAIRRAERNGTQSNYIKPVIIKRAMENSIDLDDARCQIRQAGIETELVKKHDGSVKGILFRLIDSDEWLAGSSIDRELSYRKILDQIERNRQTIQNQIKIQDRLRTQEQQRNSQQHQHRERGG